MIVEFSRPTVWYAPTRFATGSSHGRKVIVRVMHNVAAGRVGKGKGVRHSPGSHRTASGM